MSALDSYCRCKKLPQSSVEKQQRFLFIVLEVKSLPWSSQQGCNPSGGFKEQSGSLSFPSSRGRCIYWLLGPSSLFKTIRHVCSVASVVSDFCDPMDYSPSGSSVHGILQARILEWVAMPSSRGSSQPRDWTRVSYISCIGRWVLCH